MQSLPQEPTGNEARTERADSICRRLCELSATAPPDFPAMASLARQSDILAQRLLRRANSPRQGLSRPITSLQHAVVFLGASGVKDVAESMLLRVDDAHEPRPVSTGSTMRAQAEGASDISKQTTT